MKTYLSGNTIRIIATFYDFNKNKIDPQIIKFILYDHKYNIISTINIYETNKISQGIYFYDHILSSTDNNKRFYYEFYGEIGGKPSLNRGEFMVKFMLS